MLGEASAVQALSYTVTDLGTLGGASSEARGINNSGQVTGYSRTAASTFHAFLYSNGVMTDLGTLGGASYGFGINSSGQVGGYSGIGVHYYRAFLYSNDSMTNLGALGGDDHAVGYGINDSGQVVGESCNLNSGMCRAFLYSNGVMTDLGNLGGSSWTNMAYGINDSGQVTGVSNSRAFLYSNGVMTDLGILGGDSHSIGYGINDSGQVVGSSADPSGKYRAFLYSNGVMTDMGTLGGASYGYDINNSGQVVGMSADPSGKYRAFLYSNGSMTDLNNLINPASGWTLSKARAINDVGQIVGLGINPAGASHAFLLTPLENIQKNLGQPMCMNSSGNPINTGTGNKYQAETDIIAAVPFLSVTRHYNSQFSIPGPFGKNWGLYGAIKVLSATSVSATRPDQQVINFSLVGPVWTPDQDIAHKLVQTASGWQLTTADNVVENYDATGHLLSTVDLDGQTTTFTYSDAATPQTIAPIAGLLISVVDSVGRQLSFVYDSNSRVQTITDPASGIITYGYDAQSNLVSVTYPDGHSRTYHYNEPENTSGANLPNALTGITDENGDRYATYQYAADGKAISTGHAGGADLHTLTYNPDGSTTVTDPLGTARTHNFTTILGVVKSTGQSQPGGSGCGAASSAATYDANGNVASRADFNGHQTCYAYDLTRNLETARVEGLATGSTCPADLAAYTPAANSAERKILTEWHATFRLPVKITEAGRETSTVYDDHGNVTSLSIKDTALNKTRTWSTAYTYHASVPGVLVQKVDNGPRIDVSDITTTDYYAPDENCVGDPLGCRGQVRQVTNALGHVTTYDEYDAHGHVLRTTDPNGLVTTLTYSPRGWLTSRDVGGELTQFDYDYVGQLTKLTRPDASYVSFEYDPAHRLTAIVQQDGSRLTYTLDAMGNRIHEEITTPGTSYVYYTHSRTFDALGRLWQDIGALNQTVTYEYDAQGNMKQIDGARTDVADLTRHDYDPLDRLTQTLNADGGIEQTKPNALDQTTQVVDPANQSTTYTVNAFGDVTQTQSADTGNTTRTFDEAGNVKTETDARGVTVTYTYDALNRPTRKQSSDAASSIYQYFYDDCGLGYLCWTWRNNLLNNYFMYDAHGRMNYRLDFGGVGAYSLYSYRPGGQIESITYPTGRTVTYTYDAMGRTSQVATAPESGTLQMVLAGNFVYSYPFSEQRNFHYGDGTWAYQSRNPDYRPWVRFDGEFFKYYNYDPAGNVASLADMNNSLLSYTYDSTGRLTGASNTAANSFGSLGWTYDLNGNRQSETRNAGTMPYVYSPPNWLYQRAGYARLRTANGNTESIAGVANFTYDGFNRLATSTTAAETTTYVYNALGQRMKKFNQNGLSTVFHYGPNGELLWEKDQAGNTKAYVWLDGRPLARIDNDSQIYYYHVDHLGTPQSMSDAAGTTVWKADYEPFGKANVKVNTVENNLRFPGQYYDRETGLHYNYFRDYDPGTGRYVEADPIGLEGGLNVYGYVDGNPLSYVDQLGLYAEVLVSDSRLISRGSQFGHVAIDINGTVYSRTHSGWFTTSRGDYLRRQQNFRDTVGLLLDTTWGDDDALEAELLRRISQRTKYDLHSDSCSSNVSDALDKIGIHSKGPWQFDMVSPLDLLINLPKTGRVTNRYIYGRTR